MVREKEKNLEFCVSKSINKIREEERQKRIKLYGEKEDQRQQITSTLMMELIRICQQDDVPNYVTAIAKVLDNYQGK